MTDNQIARMLFLRGIFLYAGMCFGKDADDLIQGSDFDSAKWIIRVEGDCPPFGECILWEVTDTEDEIISRYVDDGIGDPQAIVNYYVKQWAFVSG